MTASAIVVMRAWSSETRSFVAAWSASWSKRVRWVSHESASVSSLAEKNAARMS